MWAVVPTEPIGNQMIMKTELVVSFDWSIGKKAECFSSVFFRKRKMFLFVHLLTSKLVYNFCSCRIFSLMIKFWCFMPNFEQCKCQNWWYFYTSTTFNRSLSIFVTYIKLFATHIFSNNHHHPFYAPLLGTALLLSWIKEAF